MSDIVKLIFCAVLLTVLGSCSEPSSTESGSSSETRVIDAARLENAGEDDGNWLMYGRTYDEHRFSPLDRVNEQTVGELGLAWSLELDTTRGLEATPLVDDGVIYTTGSWSIVYAIDARTGEVLWTYDPEVRSGSIARFVCCDVVNRGVALYRDKVYVGALDGRLIALDMDSGQPVWSVETVEAGTPYRVTGYPRIAGDKVVIGNAGAELGVRGYITAYDAETGDEAWRVYTVPGNPTLGFESDAMERAAETWDGEWWVTGGGGTAWEGIVYDPELDYVYFGTGNPTTWYRALRGAEPQDNLYAASILAVRASDGEHMWHFQPTPGDNWDFDATQPLMFAVLEIDGQARDVIMQASKNGFFYVLDRETGEFISGAPFVDGVTWATGLDPVTGRPIESPNAYQGMDPVIVAPGPTGAHNWNPMAFSPETGLVYLPAKINTHTLHAPDPDWVYDPDRDNIGGNFNYEGPLNDQLEALPDPSGELLAWDPVRQEPAWHAPYGVVEGGGVLATAGNLVFQGRADGIFAAYRATDGETLWEFDASTGIMAPPVTYLVDDEQYITVMAGWGGPEGLINAPGQGPVKPGYGRIVTFVVGGDAEFDPPVYGHDEPPAPTFTMDTTPEMIAEGEGLYGNNCSYCHGADAVAGPLPDLRYATTAVHSQFDAIVRGGAMESLGMPIQDQLSEEEVRAIQAYVLARAADSQ